MATFTLNILGKAMKILLLDGGNIADGLAQVLIPEGHDVSVTCNNWGVGRRGAKLLGYQSDFGHVLNEKWDLVIGCETSTSRDGIVDKFRERGTPTVGAGKTGFSLELKNVGRQVFGEAGMMSPRWVSFEHSKDALAFVESRTFKKLVVKFTETNRGFRTIVCDDVRDAIHVLKKFEDGAVVIEEKVNGHEVSMAMYWDGKKFIQTVATNEHKNLWRGNRGVLTPEMGTLVWYDPTDRWQEFFDSLLLSPTAQKLLKDYRGFIDINTIIDHNGDLFPLEFTCRYGVPQTDIMTALMKGDSTRQTHYGEFLLGVANGDADPSLLYHSRDFAVGVVLVVCGYPYHELYEDICVLGSPIRGIEDLTCHNTCDGAVWDGDTLVTDEAWVMTVTGVGPTIEDARSECYHNVDKISFKDMVYRDDIGKSFYGMRQHLFENGFLSHAN